LEKTLNQQEDVMKKKVLKKKLQRKPVSQHAAKPAVDSAREIWLAGLGAFSVAQQEGGRIMEQGSKLFDKLVVEGTRVEKKTRKDVESAVGEFRGEVENRVEAMKQQADAVRKQATDNWDKLEKIFENRVARAMAGLGIPSKEDVNGLADKVQKLARQVAELDGKTSTRKPAAKTVVKVSATKKAAGKKPAARKPAVRKAAKKKVARAAATPAAEKPLNPASL
jgi:poly(hydroxyalkanoate) granule-associated protein